MKKISYQLESQLKQFKDEMSQQGIKVLFHKNYDMDSGDMNLTLEAFRDGKKLASVTVGEENEQYLIDEMKRSLERTLKKMSSKFEAMSENIYDTVRDWYVMEYPSDSLGSEIDPSATFEGLYLALDEDSGDVYDYLGVDDSLVRERCFKKLSEIMKCDYSDIYDKWLA